MTVHELLQKHVRNNQLGQFRLVVPEGYWDRPLGEWTPEDILEYERDHAPKEEPYPYLKEDES